MESLESEPKRRSFWKALVGILLALLCAWPAAFGVAWLTEYGYAAIDPTRFPFA